VSHLLKFFVDVSNVSIFIGRLHVSELNDLAEYGEGSCPMQQFLERNTGKMINIKVLSVSKRKAFPVKGKRLLEERRKSDR